MKQSQIKGIGDVWWQKLLGINEFLERVLLALTKLNS